VASGWQIRRPIRRFHLTFGNCAIQGPESRNTVKTRLFYARQKLAELLKAAGIERGWP